VAATVLCGVGAVYGLRRLGVLAYGPDVAGALPLQRLAGSDGQPLLRMAGAWVPAGLLAGWAVRRRREPEPARAAAVGVLAVVLLMAIGAGSDAATVSGPFASHLAEQLTRAGTWTAAAFMAAGSAMVLVTGRAARRAPTAR
jgi:hypothetical protein